MSIPVPALLCAAIRDPDLESAHAQANESGSARTRRGAGSDRLDEFGLLGRVSCCVMIWFVCEVLFYWGFWEGRYQFCPGRGRSRGGGVGRLLTWIGVLH